MELFLSVFDGLESLKVKYFIFCGQYMTPVEHTVIEVFFAEAFPGSDHPSNEISDSSYSSDLGGGRGYNPFSVKPSANTRIRRKKLLLQLLLVIHRAK